MNAADESELIARLKAADEEALRAVIVRYEGQVAATVTGILGYGPDVDDIGQETFLQFFRSIARFRGESRIGTYLTRIAINLSLHELRRRKRFSVLPEDAAPDGGSGGSAARLRNEAQDARVLVRQGLQKLDPRFRAVIVLRLLDGFSTRETADLLGLAHGTVLSRLARGQAKLKDILAGPDPD